MVGEPEDRALEGFIAGIVAELISRGLGPVEAEPRLRGGDWWPLLCEAGPTVMATCDPADIAREVARETRCRICGHPLHRAVGAVRLSVGGRLRLVRRLPHIAPCSCGYAERVLDPPLAEALERHFARRPEAVELDAGDPSFADEVRRVREEGVSTDA